MTDDAWRYMLEPPAGGLARLVESVQTQRNAVRYPFALAAIGAVCALLIAVGTMRYQYLHNGPQRRIESALRAAFEPTQQIRVANGAALELSSSRADVRIFLIASLPMNSGAAAP
jgi:hypothetical protein